MQFLEKKKLNILNMRLFFIGSSVPEEDNNIVEFCRNIGGKLAIKAVQILICSPYQDAIDPHIIDGIKKVKNIKLNIEAHYPNTEKNELAWDNVLDGLPPSIRISKFRHEAPVNDQLNTIKYAWLYCQMQAVSKADFVIVIGGKIAGSSNLLVRIAEAQNKGIIPLPKFGGVGQLFFAKKRFQLKDDWGAKNFNVFEQCKKPAKIIDIIVDASKDKRFELIKSKKKEISFFISYSKERPTDADFVEMMLRRRNHEVLRDDTEIRPSQDIPAALKESIHRSDVFVFLWCKESACSPWCYDELNLALKSHHEREGKALWIFKLDETRIIHPDARNLLSYQTNSREKLAERIISLLELPQQP
jgi:hypothetical protein